MHSSVAIIIQLKGAQRCFHTANEIHQSQAFFGLARSTQPKTPAGDNG